MAWYNLDNKSEKKEDVTQHLAVVKYNEIICSKADDFKGLVSDDIKKGNQYRLISSRAFNAIVVLQYLYEKYDIEELFLVIYRMNEKSVNKFKEIISSDVKGGILVSSFFRNNKIYEKWAKNLVSFCSENDNMKISFAVTHAKIFIVKTKCGKHIVFEGSGNFSDNARIEQYLLEDNENVYNFHKKWITEILN